MSKLEEIWGSNEINDEDEYIDNNRYDEDRYDREDENYNEEYKATFEQEVNALSQSNVSRSCYVGIDYSDDKKIRDKKIRELSPEDRFKFELDKFVKNIDEKIKLSIQDRDEMCENANKIGNIKYLNHVAYVLGYWLTKGGVKIDDKKWEKIKGFDENEEQIINIDTKESNVKPPDVIRYARLWLKFKGNLH